MLRKTGEAHESGVDSAPAPPCDDQTLSACAACSLRNGCLPRDLSAEALDAFSALARLKRTITQSSALFRTGDRLTAIYVVRSGTFKTVNVSREGHQKITGFYLPGDLLGLDAIADCVTQCNAIALEDSSVCVLPVQQLESLGYALPALQRRFTRALSDAIVRDRELLLLGPMDAEHRVANLLLDLANRYHQLGYSANRLLLHMTREDIANYLCLSGETVSRVITRLRQKGLLTGQQRDIEFPDVQRLVQTSVW